MFHAPLIIMSQKCFFDFRSPRLPSDIRIWTRGFPLEMWSWKPGLPFATRARKRELSIPRRYPVSRMTRTENFLSQNFSKFFWKSLFYTIHATLITLSQKYIFRISKKWKFWLPCSLLAENIFRFFSRNIFFGSKIF